MDVLSLLLLLLFLLSCVVGERVLSQALHPKTIRLLGWILGLGVYGAWSISFLKSNWDPGQGARDGGIMLLWLVLFPCALLLAFPPGFLKRWKIYLLAVTSFVATETYLLWSVFKILSHPNFDDSAGAIFAPVMILLPAVLLVCLMALRLFACALKRIWSMCIARRD